MQERNACDEYRQVSRRQFVGGATALTAALALPAWMPKVAFAQSHSSDRDVLISIFLRGGADALSMVVPHADPLYAQYRPNTKVVFGNPAATSALSLNGYFYMAPQLQPLMEIWNAGDLAVVHAVGRENWTRSHFEGQKLMEAGAPNPNESGGWLGRHLASTVPMNPAGLVRGISFSSGLQRQISGAQGVIAMKDPSVFKMESGLANDEEIRTYLMRQYMRVNDITRESVRVGKRTVDAIQQLGLGNYSPSHGVAYSDNDFGQAMKNCAALMKAEVGVEAMHVDIFNWDTHAKQGTMDGDMHANMTKLAQGLSAFYRDMAGTGQKYTVVVMSEFGRQIEENGSEGTEHGTAGAMFVMGSGVNGQQVYTDWPGMEPENRYQGVDLKPTTDYRDVLFEIVQRRLGNTKLDFVFPGYTPQQTLNIVQAA